jgi:transaldolase
MEVISMNRMQQLSALGQSVWLDYIDRPLLEEGILARMVEEDAVVGVTSNPAIFQKAIASGTDYAELLAALAPGAADAKSLYEQVAIRDIQQAADVLRGVYDRTAGIDGYVSLEVAPELARDTDGTVAEALRLWAAVDRKNLMIKVPGTTEGMPAIEALIAEGLNVNVTLLFAREMYEQTAQAYLRGLEKRRDAGKSVAGIASVASFFISRIDSAADAALTKRGGDAIGLKGKTAIANAVLAYDHYQALCASERWQALSGAGAMPQRLLWASTSTKDPTYRDVLYVESLIGNETVNTLPPATLEAFRDHGESAEALSGVSEDAAKTLAAVADAGVDLDALTDRLLDEGIKSFADAFDALLAAVESARTA